MPHSIANDDDPHIWDLNETEAEQIQKNMAGRVIREDQLGTVNHVAGVDADYDDTKQRQIAAAVVLDPHTLEVVETAVARAPLRFPYIPGLFSFREMPAIVRALRKLKTRPDLVVCDGQGIAHPRRFGLACHLGVFLDIPTIGCSKTRLIGKAEAPGTSRGDQSLLVDGREVIGAVLRTQDKVKPLYVSIGHRVCLQTACQWVLKLAPRYRLPETTRQSDQLVRKLEAKAT